MTRNRDDGASMSQAKLAGLEDQVAELSERLRAVELEKARYKAERDALSQRVDTLQSSGARQPTPDPLVRSSGIVPHCARPASCADAVRRWRAESDRHWLNVRPVVMFKDNVRHFIVGCYLCCSPRDMLSQSNQPIILTLTLTPTLT